MNVILTSPPDATHKTLHILVIRTAVLIFNTMPTLWLNVTSTVSTRNGSLVTEENLAYNHGRGADRSPNTDDRTAYWCITSMPK